jgi:hypothetical protein
MVIKQGRRLGNIEYKADCSFKEYDEGRTGKLNQND